jgi:hypothetical protein
MSDNNSEVLATGNNPGDLRRIRSRPAFPRTSASGGGKLLRRIRNDASRPEKPHGNPDRCRDAIRESDRCRPRMQIFAM